MNSTEMRKIPQTEIILNDPRLETWIERISRKLVSVAVRNAVEYSRKKIRSGGSFDAEELYSNIDKLCGRLYNRRIQPVVNATGVLLHTNMGRSPILKQAWDECAAVNTGYSNLELSLETGKRGKRNGLMPYFISLLTGAESCAVVNNNAAAVYLILNTFAAGKEVIVSRGEQVQIGGGFRIPEILALSGAKLVEVGTTNITTTDDYLNAVTGNTAMVLRVHRSNFAIRGFTAEPGIAELSKALPDHVIIASDQGSGVFNEKLPGEQQAAGILRDGADLITFSGDKVLGGPQAGIIAGKKSLVSAIERNPLIRTMRPGKTIYSLLESTLLYRLNSTESESRHSLTAEKSDEAKARCRKLKKGLSAEKFQVIPDRICIGGGSTPDQYFDSWSVEVSSEKYGAEKILTLLRKASPPVIAKIRDNKVIINPAGFSDEDQKHVKSVLSEVEEKI